MKQSIFKFKRVLILFALVAASAAAQQIDPTTQINWPNSTGAGAPLISCTIANYGQPYTDTTGHTSYVCDSTGWRALAGGSGGAVNSVFGRTGTVVAVSGDYTVAQVTGAAPIANPAFTGNASLTNSSTLGPATFTITGNNSTGNEAALYLYQGASFQGAFSVDSSSNVHIANNAIDLFNTGGNVSGNLHTADLNLNAWDITGAGKATVTVGNGGQANSGSGGFSVYSGRTSPSLWFHVDGTTVKFSALAGAATYCLQADSTGLVTNTGSACGSGGSMTWPAAAGIAVYAGGSAWGISLTAPASAIVGISDSQTLTNKSIAGSEINSSTVGSTYGGTGQNWGASSGIPSFNAGVASLYNSSCSSASSALTWNNSTLTYGCNTISGSGTVTDGSGVTTANIIPVSTTTAHTLGYTPNSTFNLLAPAITANDTVATVGFGNIFTGANRFGATTNFGTASTTTGGLYLFNSGFSGSDEILATGQASSFTATIPTLTANTFFGMLNLTQTFTGVNTFSSAAAGTPALVVTNSGTSNVSVASFLGPSLTSGYSMWLFLGQAATANNSGLLSFNYIGAGSAYNHALVGIASAPTAMSVFPNGGVQLGTIAASTSPIANGVTLSNSTAATSATCTVGGGYGLWGFDWASSASTASNWTITPTCVAGNPTVSNTLTIANSIASSSVPAYVVINGVTITGYGTTGTITGTALTATCDTGTATVNGAIVGHPVSVSSTTGADVGGAFNLRASVTSTNTVTVYVCGTGTPASLAYNVTVF